MRKDRKAVSFFKIWMPIVILTTVSLWFAAARDEGGGDGVVRNFIADLFWIFRFPTHPLFWDLMDDYPLFFFPGLIINTIVYSLIVYLVINFLPISNNGKTIYRSEK